MDRFIGSLSGAGVATGSVQIFSKKADAIFRWVLWSLSIAVLGGTAAGLLWFRSPAATGAGHAPDQPVAFSHEHHVDHLGIDCRYCHLTVETSAFAGVPATEICMSCHSQVWTDAPMLAPVRESFADNRPLRWRRVYDLPDHVYFDHSIHVSRGIGCESCHGRVDRQPMTRQRSSLHMRFCLGCHRDPLPHLRPVDAVFTMGWQRPAEFDPESRFRELGIAGPDRLSQCSICHR